MVTHPYRKFSYTLVNMEQPVFNPDDYHFPGFSRDQIETFKEAFDIIDSDNNGSIELLELRDSLIALGLASKSSVAIDVLNNLDADGSGSINFQEFLEALTSKIPKFTSRADTDRAFRMFDTRKEGKIGLRELREASREFGEDMSDEELLKMVKRADFDEDDKVGPDEFYRLFFATTY
jgi:Ca2+-binding EF-hand superfamily protein